MNVLLPPPVKACLWSYNTDTMDISNKDHRSRIIHNVLDRGTSEAVQWLRATFSEVEITEAIMASKASEWSKKSLSLWSLVYSVHPKKKRRPI